MNFSKQYIKYHLAIINSTANSARIADCSYRILSHTAGETELIANHEQRATEVGFGRSQLTQSEQQQIIQGATALVAQ